MPRVGPPRPRPRLPASRTDEPGEEPSDERYPGNDALAQHLIAAVPAPDPSPAAPAPASPRTPPVPFRTALAFWLRLGCVSFGGPAGQIAVMHDELVDRRRWIDEKRFLHALNYCMVLPGPEATQLAVYVGWLMHGVPGGLVAGTLFVLPGALVMLALSWTYAALGHVPAIQAAFFGLRAAVIAIVLSALLRIGAHALVSWPKRTLAAGSFVALFGFGAPFPVVLLVAGVVGLWIGAPRTGAAPDSARPRGETAAGLADPAAHARPGRAAWRAARTLAIGLVVWLGPLALVALWRGPADVLTLEGIFFAKAAMITFGGAYAVLAYVQQQAVQRFAWVSAAQMLDGLGLAETTPGPLILVLQFVGFLGAWSAPGGLPRGLAAALGAAVTLWATFAPCFLWIFLGAPWIERWRDRPRIDAVLGGITAAVVGVIASLAVTLATHALFRDTGRLVLAGHAIAWPHWATVDPWSATIATLVFLALWKLRWPLVPVVLASAFAGLLRLL